jgi:hypothetical protein
MVLTRPLYTPVHILAEYWHDNENKLNDELRKASLMNEYRGQIREPLYVYDTQIPNLDAAKQIVRQEMITG